MTDAGKTSILASVHLHTPHKVSKYGVDVPALESMLPPLFHYQRQHLLYIDEIGQMELYSPLFGKLVEEYLHAPNVFLGTLSAVYHDDLTAALRKRKDVERVEITVENRATAYADIKWAVQNAMRKL